MIQFIFPLIYLCLINSFFIAVFNKKFEETLSASIFSVVILMITTGFIKKLSYGYYLSIIMILSAIILIIYRIVKDKTYLKQFIRNFFTIGLIFFILIYLYIMLLHKETTFLYWDEFMHWGFMAKESFRINAFYSIPESFLRVHKDYPPFSTILEVLWCKLSGNYYSEPFTFRALSILIFSFILPFFKSLSIKKGRDYIKGIIIVLFYLLIQVISFNDFFPSFTDSIYTDYILAALCAYGIYSAYIYDFSKFSLLKLSLILISTILCKQMGLPLFILIIFTLIIKHYKRINSKTIIQIIVLTIIPFTYYKIWGIYISSLNIGGQFSLSQISIKDFFNIALNNQGLPHQTAAFHNYLNALVNRPILSSLGKLNYIFSTLLITAILLISEYAFKKEIKYSIIYLLGSIGYGLGMMLLYIFSFNDYEGPLLASYERYMGTFIYLGFILIVFLIAGLIIENKLKYHIQIIFFIFLFSLTSNASRLKLIPKENNNSYLDNPIYSSIIYAVDSNEIIYKKILIIAQYQNDIREVAQYSSPFNDFQIATIGKPKYEGDINAWDLSLEDTKTFFKEFDYIFISNTDEPFYNDFWINITDLQLLNNQLYKVIIKNDELIMEYVN